MVHWDHNHGDSLLLFNGQSQIFYSMKYNQLLPILMLQLTKFKQVAVFLQGLPYAWAYVQIFITFVYSGTDNFISIPTVVLELHTSTSNHS